MTGQDKDTAADVSRARSGRALGRLESMRSRPGRLPAAVLLAAAAVFLLILVAFVSGGIFEHGGDSPPPGTPAEAFDDEMLAARDSYNRLFLIMVHRRYDGGLPHAASTVQALGVLADKYPSRAWIQDYFRRAAQWERDLREWEFARESRSFNSPNRSP
ncbi:MAG: hypothetical protein JW909_01015 [Planctomycetes bacterium]|nr:hypothetical protein [Planctomycetota bacterium]